MEKFDSSDHQKSNSTEWMKQQQLFIIILPLFEIIIFIAFDYVVV